MNAIRLSVSQPSPHSIQKKKSWSELKEMGSGLSPGWTISEFVTDVGGE